MKNIMNTDYLNIYIIPWGTKIIIAVLIFVVGRYLIKYLTNMLGNILLKRKLTKLL